MMTGFGDDAAGAVRADTIKEGSTRNRGGQALVIRGGQRNTLTRWIGTKGE